MQKDFDNEIQEALDEFKGNLENEKLSKSFKMNLEETLKLKNKEQIKKNPLSWKKYAVAFASCFIIITGICFAGDFENVILKHFSNVDKIAKEAIENNEVQYIEDAVSSDKDITIRVKYVIVKDNNLYVALETTTDKYEYDEILIDEIEFTDSKNNAIRDSINNEGIKKINKYYDKENKEIVYFHLGNLENKNSEINAVIKSITVVKDGKYIDVYGNWNIKLDLNKNKD